MAGTTISTTLPVEFRRWQVPDSAVHVTPPGNRQDGFLQKSPVTNVEQLPPQALDAMAQAWIDDLYARAGRQGPKLHYD